MKFACDKCNTRYSIADERVHGRVLKIRCKACNHVITVREPDVAPMPAVDEDDPLGGDDEHTRVSMGPPPSSAAAATAPPTANAATGDDDWFVSFDGDQEGPLPLARALDRVRAERPHGKECFCWRAGFFVWLPVEDVPEFAPALGRAAPPPPPAKSAAKAPPPAAKTPAPPTKAGTLPPLKSPTGPLPAMGAKSSTGPQAKIGGTTGAQAKSSTGPQAPIKVGSSTGPQAPIKVGSSTGPQAKIGSSTGPQAPVKAGSSTGPQAKIGSSTGPQAAVKSVTGAQATVKSPTGPLPVAPSKPSVDHRPHSVVDLPSPPLDDLSDDLEEELRPLELPRPSADRPPLFESGPMNVGGAPSVVMPQATTRPEPRFGKKASDEPLLPKMNDAPSAPSSLSPFRAALQTSGPAHANHDASHLKVPDAPKLGELPLDTGPVPLPPPPDDLPIGEASGLISLAHLAKPSLMTATVEPGRRSAIDTFGGVPVVQSGKMSVPASAAMVSAEPMIAPRGGAPWMKWAALAGALATIGLTVAVIMLLTRKPTVIVVPPAPIVESQRKVDDKPITVTDDAPTPQAPTPGSDKRPQKRVSSARSAAVAQKSPPTAPSTASPGADLSNSQRNLASLYRDEGGEHGAKGSPTLDNGAHGGGQVSQQAIMAVPTQNRRSLSLCYDRVLKHDSTLKSGRILIHVKIGISGSVTGVAVPDPQYSGSEIGQCLVQTIKHWHFPSADSEYETEFPIILQAN